MLEEAGVPAGNILDIVLTNITSPPSLRPAEGSIVFQVKTTEGFMVEEQGTGLGVVNKKPSRISNTSAGISPSYFELSYFANYTIQF